MADREPLDNRWEPPATAVAWAVQFPVSDPGFADRMVNASARDAADARRSEREPARERIG